MPNAKKHITVGAAVGGGLNLAWQIYNLFDSPNPPKSLWETLRRINFLEVAAIGAVGAACGALPDLIEPATSSNHRALFHSFACAGAISYGAFGKHTENLPSKGRHALRVAASTYLSHLILDGGTRKGLPVLGLAPIKFD